MSCRFQDSDCWCHFGGGYVPCLYKGESEKCPYAVEGEFSEEISGEAFLEKLKSIHISSKATPTRRRV